ncbi:transposase, Mutator family protein [Mycobacterium avium MAV_061107_1842]|nr:transposase, Mutator family protein [Mycobacterium avium MAV_061107_1842]
MVKRPRITTERNIAMALDQSALLEVLDALRTADAGERITQAAETIYQALIDAELTAFIGASPHERTETRSNQRNGSRPRTLSTVAGDLELRIPKLRTGSFSRRCWSGVAGSISACSRW